MEALRDSQRVSPCHIRTDLPTLEMYCTDDRPTARPAPVIDSYGAPVTPLLDSYGAPVTRPYSEDDLSGVIIAKTNPVIGIKTPRINEKRPTYFDVVTPSPLPQKRPKVKLRPIK